MFKIDVSAFLPPEERSEKYKRRDAYIELLRKYDWKWFVTHTFTESIHSEQARKYWSRWINNLNRKLYGKNWREQGGGVYWILASEKQKRGVLHYHALITDCNLLPESRILWMTNWEELAAKTGYSRIYPASQEAVIRYVTKYVIKEGDIELCPHLHQYVSQVELVS